MKRQKMMKIILGIAVLFIAILSIIIYLCVRSNDSEKFVIKDNVTVITEDSLQPIAVSESELIFAESWRTLYEW